MDIQYKKIISLFFAALSICICVICTSCSDTNVDLPTLYPRIIYLYPNDKDTPEVFLSVYSEVSSDAERLSSLKVQHAESGLSWQIQPVQILKDSKGKTYAGSNSIKMPENEAFPEGIYTVIFTDYAGNTSVSTFTLGKTALEKMPSASEKNKKYIVYDKNGNVLYISSDSNNTSDTVKALSSKYPKAKTVREYVSDIKKKAVYILPEESTGKNK